MCVTLVLGALYFPRLLGGGRGKNYEFLSGSVQLSFMCLAVLVSGDEQRAITTLTVWALCWIVLTGRVRNHRKNTACVCFGSRIYRCFTISYPVIEEKRSLAKSSLNTFWKVKSNAGRDLCFFPVRACRISGACKQKLFCTRTACSYIHKYTSMFTRTFIFPRASFLYNNLKTYFNVSRPAVVNL
jgi:hypothetical protein